MNERIALRVMFAMQRGDVKRVAGVLCRDGGFCALGAVADVYVAENDDAEWRNGRFLAIGIGTGLVDEYAAVLPYKVKEWAGLSEYEESLIMATSDGRDSEDWEMMIPLLRQLAGVEYGPIYDPQHCQVL